ncbi:unnamed protein product [Bursaphelenchus okinawaensis]|uniref:Uncharacterized protein n=1 Tax=Bursaphelenchus okinawaensis TaxID=465554 RepID=A0A811JUX6_9BILA|nr:unnamed protein product [Bursaphelenchus okinawaensis]CAG9084377.1 unnamed protein product [Bursaphelenchus okinawaensis]
MKSTWFLADMARPLTIVLASESPRRLELLKQVGLNPIVCPSGFDEVLNEVLTPRDFVEKCSFEKAKSVKQSWIEQKKPFDIVLGSDTIIEIDGLILGKPKDDQEAMEVLKKLSGRTHLCLTGVSLQTPTKDRTFVVETKVRFKELPDSLIKAYIQTQEHVGRAGSYSIQGKAAVFVDGIEGCYNNVVGLPVSKVVQEMAELIE